MPDVFTRRGYWEGIDDWMGLDHSGLLAGMRFLEGRIVHW